MRGFVIVVLIQYCHCVTVQGLVGKPEGRRPLGRPRRRWEDGVRMNLGEIGLGDVDWIRLAQDRDRWRAVVSAVMNLRVLAPRSLFVCLFVSHCVTSGNKTERNTNGGNRGVSLGLSLDN
jgi:hypothetical protein